jgi:hypothetical protein
MHLQQMHSTKQTLQYRNLIVKSTCSRIVLSTCTIEHNTHGCRAALHSSFRQCTCDCGSARSLMDTHQSYGTALTHSPRHASHALLREFSGKKPYHVLFCTQACVYQDTELLTVCMESSEWLRFLHPCQLEWLTSSARDHLAFRLHLGSRMK